MRRSVHIHPEAPVVLDGALELAARIDWPRSLGRRRSQRIFFRVSDAAPADATSCATPFLLGALFRCMELGRPVRVHGEVAPGLLENLDRFQANWASWMPVRYRRVSITAEGTTPPRSGGQGACLAYSGGIDSTYAVRHLLLDGDGRGSAERGSAVMVHGFDIPVEASEGFERALARARRILDSRGVPLRSVATNVREIRMSWEDANRAVIAGVLHLFRGRHARGLIANSYEASLARRFFPEDVEDPPLASSVDFPVEVCATERDRVGRLEGILDWPEALADLRVCYVDPRWDRNCGRCGKCIIVMLAARVLGAGALPCFDRDVEDHEIVRMLEDPHQIIPVRAQQLLEHARRRGIDEPWMRVAERVRGDDPLRRIRAEAQALGRPPVGDA